MWTDKSKRFSLLLLQEGEHYIQDWIATCRPASSTAWLQQQPAFKGRLRLCSRSVFFEADDTSIPILMFPFNKTIDIEQNSGGFLLESNLLVKMKENCKDAPYECDKSQGTWWFSLDYAPVEQFLQQAESLVYVNSLPPAERDAILQNSAAQKEAHLQFDISRLRDFNEEIVFNYPAAQVTPLIREPGRLVLAEGFLYFQPLHNLNNDSPVRSQKITSIVAIAKRRHSLRHIGLEIFFENASMFTKSTPAAALIDGDCVFFTFRSVEERDDVLSKLLHSLQSHTGMVTTVGSLLDKDGSWLDRVTAAWQGGRVSNYDYLMYLNLVAGRSRCDLTQWPVMPWVLKDYESSVLDLDNSETFRDLSQPIGALNPARLAVFKERLRQMLASDGPFLYGTHYSAPGYVLYWLVREAPAHMLRLQNGRFDAPDRLFLSMLESWRSVLTNHADVKELIPEFYTLPSDFMLTRVDLNLGIRQNGVPVGDVKLPSWSSDPDDFVRKHRSALECKHVSSHLHKWIDLIFGYQQKGEAALAANNLFHPLTYEGAVDLEKIEDPVKRTSLEAQINEFGQAPQQLFTGPHPSRSDSETPVQFEVRGGRSSAAVLSRIMLQTVSYETGAPDSATTSHTAEELPPLDISKPVKIFSTNEATPREAVVTPDAQPAYYQSYYYDDPPWCSTPQTPQLDVRFQKPVKPANEPANLVGWSEASSSRPWTLEKLAQSQAWTVNREPVNAVLLSDENASESVTLYSASKGGLVKVYSVTEGFQVRATKLGSLSISSLALASGKDAYPTVLAGSLDNCVYAYSVDYGRSLGKARVHDDAVSCLRVIDHSMITASWDGTAKVWRLDEGRSAWNGGTCVPELELAEHDSAIWSLDVDEQCHIVTSGGEDGSVISWDLRSASSPIWTSKELSGSATSMRLTGDGNHLIVCSSSGNTYALELRLGGTILSEKSYGVALQSCEVLGDDVALVGSANGELHFWAWKSWDASCSSCSCVQHLPSRQYHSDAITSIGYAKRHGMVATSSEDCSVHMYQQKLV